MLNLILAFVPNSALPLIIAGAGLLVMLGVVKPRAAFGFVGVFVLIIVATPFIEELVAQIPIGWIVLILLGIGFWAVRTVLEFVLGKHAAGHVIGTAFVAMTVLFFKLLFFPCRLISRAIRARSAGATRRHTNLGDQ